MYYLEKTFCISASHSLKLNYDSPCQNRHGHNWKITVYCRAASLNGDGMVIDFTEIKRVVHGELDHQHINDVVIFNPTAENLARWVVEHIPTCYKARVEETEGNSATYEV